MTPTPPSKLLANRTPWLISCTLAAALFTSAADGAPQEKVNPTGAQVKAFLDRINAYVQQKKKLEGDLQPPSPSDRTTGVEQHRAALAERIRTARRGARQGDLFGEAGALFTEIIARDSRTRSTRDKGAVLEEVPSGRTPVVNAVYPEQAALATVPPLILTNLPPLPDGLEYRFMGQALILRDRTANLVLDFVPGAVPRVR